jgi:hypothetical protein
VKLTQEFFNKTALLQRLKIMKVKIKKEKQEQLGL